MLPTSGRRKCFQHSRQPDLATPVRPRGIHGYPSSTGAHAPGKYYPHSIQIEPPRLIGGLVIHPLVTATTQIKILDVVEDTGSATIGDIIAELLDHPDPASAILIMVELKILVIEPNGVIDAHTVVRRADPEPDPENQGAPPPSPKDGLDTASASSVVSNFSSKDAAPNTVLPDGLERLEVNPFLPNVVVGSGEARRAFARMPELHRPGVYMLMNADRIYVGTGADVGLRVASRQQPVADIVTIAIITDAHGNLTEDDAKAAERLLWSRVAAAGGRVLVNGIPDGASIDAQRLGELEAMLGAACLALRNADSLFTTGSARAVLAGPRQEPGRLAPLRPFNDIPNGEVLELNFGTGMVALAARQSDTHWILLQGSDVRTDTVASANASTRFLRAAWLHAGLLEVAPDGLSLTTTRDLVFRSGSGLAQFCAGSKGRTLESWKPVAPDGGYDADIAASSPLKLAAGFGTPDHPPRLSALIDPLWIGPTPGACMSCLTSTTNMMMMTTPSYRAHWRLLPSTLAKRSAKKRLRTP